MNVAAYDAAKEKLQRENAGKWTIIVRGDVSGPFASFEEALRRADELGPDDSHRFIWRPGEDDVPREFELSLWMEKPGEYGNWMQLGIAFPVRLKIQETISTSLGVQWAYQGREKSWPIRDVSRVTLTLGSPVGKIEEEKEMVRSLSFVHDITLDPEIAERLQVERAAVPGFARPVATENDWRLAWVRVKEPTLGIDERVVAFLVPRAMWRRAESR